MLESDCDLETMISLVFKFLYWKGITKTPLSSINSKNSLDDNMMDLNFMEKVCAVKDELLPNGIIKLD